MADPVVKEVVAKVEVAKVEVGRTRMNLQERWKWQSEYPQALSFGGMTKFWWVQRCYLEDF